MRGVGVRRRTAFPRRGERGGHRLIKRPPRAARARRSRTEQQDLASPARLVAEDLSPSANHRLRERALACVFIQGTRLGVPHARHSPTLREAAQNGLERCHALAQPGPAGPIAPVSTPRSASRSGGGVEPTVGGPHDRTGFEAQRESAANRVATPLWRQWMRPRHNGCHHTEIDPVISYRL